VPYDVLCGGVLDDELILKVELLLEQIFTRNTSSPSTMSVVDRSEYRARCDNCDRERARALHRRHHPARHVPLASLPKLPNNGGW
jgi:hypothetical protein